MKVTRWAFAAWLVGCSGDDEGAGAAPEATVWTTAQGPIDAAPLSDGSAVVFVAEDGATLCLLEDGASEPTCNGTAVRGATAIVPSPDDELVYVAGSVQQDTRAAIVAGAVVSALCAYFGCRAEEEPRILPGTEGYEITAFARMQGGPLTFAAVDAEGVPGVFEVPVDGGEVTRLASGLDSAPTGVVIADDGAVYAAGGGTVWEITNGVATAIVEDETLGTPAGIEISPDEVTVMVSSLSDAGTAQVLLVDRATASTSIFDEGISTNTAAGGLHRASGDPYTYAWVDSDGSGSVYRVAFPR